MIIIMNFIQKQSRTESVLTQQRDEPQFHLVRNDDKPFICIIIVVDHQWSADCRPQLKRSVFKPKFSTTVVTSAYHMRFLSKWKWAHKIKLARLKEDIFVFPW